MGRNIKGCVCMWAPRFSFLLLILGQVQSRRSVGIYFKIRSINGNRNLLLRGIHCNRAYLACFVLRGLVFRLFFGVGTRKGCPYIFYMASNAWVKSAFKSSMCSIPTQRRIKSWVTPAFACSSSVN